MALPIHGAWKSLRRRVAGQPEKSLRKPREQISVQAALRLDPEERESIRESFAEKEKGAGDRKRRMKRRAKLLLMGDERGFEEDAGGSGESTDEECNSGSEKGQAGSPKGGVAAKGLGEKVMVPLDGTVLQATHDQTRDPDESAAGDGGKSLDRGERSELEEAERRGYERALKEMREKDDIERERDTEGERNIDRANCGL
jgi:hypothetical protein